MIKALLLSCLLLVSVSAPALAEPEDVIRFDLSLGGYRLGMNYEEAVLVRPFARVGNRRTYPTSPEVTIGFVGQLLVDGTEFSFRVEFIDEKVFKIIGRFPPAELERLEETLLEALGDGELDIKTIVNSAGTETRIRHDRWKFPGASLDLIGTTANTDYATLSLAARGRAAEQRHAQSREAAIKSVAGTKD